MSTKDLLLGFKEHLAVLNRSNATISAYSEHTKHFLDSFNGVDVKQITSNMIEKYIADLFKHRTKKKEPYKIGTICLKVRSIKRFFEYLEQRNVVFISPAEFIKEPKKQYANKDVLSQTEINKILNEPDLSKAPGLRDRTILEVLYATGIRLNELCQLNIQDVDLKEGLLRINNGKGGKDRVVPLGTHSIKFLKEYIKKARPMLEESDSVSKRLFLNRYGGPMSHQVIRIMIKNCSKACKIKKQVTPHTFRHTFATHLVKNGGDIVAVQRMLGHTDLRTTQIYIRSLGLDLKLVHKETHPREKDKAHNVNITKFEMKKGHYGKK